MSAKQHSKMQARSAARAKELRALANPAKLNRGPKPRRAPGSPAAAPSPSPAPVPPASTATKVSDLLSYHYPVLLASFLRRRVLRLLWTATAGTGKDSLQAVPVRSVLFGAFLLSPRAFNLASKFASYGTV